MIVTVGEKPETITVSSPELQSAVSWFHSPREVLVDHTSVGGKTTLVAVGLTVTRTGRVWAIALSVLLWLLFSVIFLRGRYRELILGTDNRYSNSKFQMALWFAMLLTAYGAAVILRAQGSHWQLIGGVDIPQNLLLLSGMSALTFAGAKAITQTKVDQAAATPAAQTKNTGTRPSFPGDLLNNDLGRIDFGDFQMLLVTLLAVVVYIAQMLVFLGTIRLVPAITLPDVDTTILGAFGLGQGAYLAKKLAARVGEG